VHLPVFEISQVLINFISFVFCFWCISCHSHHLSLCQSFGDGSLVRRVNGPKCGECRFC